MSKTSLPVTLTNPLATPPVLGPGRDVHEFEDWARLALRRYALPPPLTARLINISENMTFHVSDGAGAEYALRLHRLGYHDAAAINSELAWLSALRQAGVALTPRPVAGLDGALLQAFQIAHGAGGRHAVLFQWEPGKEPVPDDLAGYQRLGMTAARLHGHVQTWTKPAGFSRHTWNFATSLGDRPHWGRWRDGMGMTVALQQLFARAVRAIEARLARFGQTPDRFGLVHGDMRLANLLVDGDNLKIIDFDDCGFSWFLYDAATTVSFFEHDARVPERLAAWAEGYRQIRTLSASEELDLPTFVLLRRLLLIAWLSSRTGTELANTLGAAYTRTAAPMCEDYLRKFG